MNTILEEIRDYDKFIDGKCKGAFLGGIGGFVYVDKDGVPNTTFQCSIDEMCDTDEHGNAYKGEDAMYGLESDMIKLGNTYEYPIMDVSKGESYMMVTKLQEPYRSEFLYRWMSRNYTETDNANGLITDSWGTFDADKLKKAYKYYNQKIR